jgi:hypothetical protein
MPNLGPEALETLVALLVVAGIAVIGGGAAGLLVSLVICP